MLNRGIPRTVPHFSGQIKLGIKFFSFHGKRFSFFLGIFSTAQILWIRNISYITEESSVVHSLGFEFQVFCLNNSSFKSKIIGNWFMLQWFDKFIELASLLNPILLNISRKIRNITLFEYYYSLIQFWLIILLIYFSAYYISSSNMKLIVLTALFLICLVQFSHSADLVIRIPGDLSQQDGFYRLDYR